MRAGLLNKDGEVVTNPDCDEMFRDHEALAAASSASIAGKIAFGPNAGRHVTKVGSGFGYYEETPLAKGRLLYSVNGFLKLVKLARMKKLRARRKARRFGGRVGRGFFLASSRLTSDAASVGASFA